MDETLKIILVGVIVLATHCLEGITGFGCTVLALPFIVMLLGLKTAVPVLVVLAWLLAIYIILRSWKKISWKEFFFIVVYVGLGLPIGIALFDCFSEHVLKGILAVFMILVGLHGFYRTVQSKEALLNGHAPPTPPKSLFMRGVLFLGGIIHGAFGTGGPFVVIYASKALANKTLFRVTLCLLWFSLNTVMMLKWTFTDSGAWNRETGLGIATSLPFLVAGMLLGDYLHHKVNEYYFKIVVYFVLFSSGLAMGYSVIN